jgi:hypothetical protein
MNTPPNLEQKTERLAKLFSLNADPIGEWTPNEYKAMWRHQLAQPLLVDLGALPEQRLWELKQLAKAQGPLLKSMSDLLLHGHPPMDLLLLLKDFAKANRVPGESLLPKDIAAALYYASIAAALVKCHTRISRLSDLELCRAFDWAVTRDWIDAESDALFRAAAAIVRPPETDG